MAMVLIAVLLVAGQWGLRLATVGLDHETARTVPDVLPLVIGLPVMTGVFLLLSTQLQRVAASGTALLVLVLTGLAMRLVWLGAAPPLEDDFNRYLIDGALVAHGLDPYRFTPGELLAGNDLPDAYSAVAKAAGATLSGVNFPELRTIYPSVAQLAFALAYILVPFQVDGLRVVFLGGELAALAVIMGLLRQRGQSPLWAALYWCNPLVAYVAIAAAHIDALIPVFVVGAIWAAVSARPTLAVALLGAGAGIKLWPLVLVPLVIWRQRAAFAQTLGLLITVSVVVAVAVGPLVWSALEPQSGLAAYAARWSNNNAFFAWGLQGLTVVGGEQAAQSILRGAIALFVVGLTLVLALRQRRPGEDLAVGALVLSASIFYLSPAQFPWYTVWFLPLAALLRSWPLLFASVVIPVYYLFFPLWASGRGDLFIYWIGFLHALPVLVWIAIDRFRSRSSALRSLVP